MTEIGCVSNVDVKRSIGRHGTSWIDQVKAVILYSKNFSDCEPIGEHT